MSALLTTGAVLAFGVGLAHSLLGERYVLVRLFRRPDLPKLFGTDRFTRRTLRFAWHLTTVAWWGFGAQMVLAAGAPAALPAEALRVIAGTFGVSAVITLVASRGRHLAWIVFLAIAVCAWLAAS
jgi:hypothetical protein